MCLKQKILLSVLIGFTVTGAAMYYLTTVKADIEKSVLRFHVVANSNSKKDQQLKMKVRDDIAQYLNDKLNGCNSLDTVNEVVKCELQNIADAACKTVQAEGYGYSVTARLGNFYFPTKQYEGFAFPAGNYNALRITLGSGAGENWWCVLYPQLCFVSSGKGKLAEQDKQKLKNVLSEDEYKIIVNAETGDYPVKIKFKLLELLGRRN